MVDKTTSAAAIADAPQEQAAQPTHYSAPAKRLPGLAIAGIVVGGVLLLGGTFGTGVLVGSHVGSSHSQFGFHHGDDFRQGMNGMNGMGDRQFGNGQYQIRPGFPGQGGQQGTIQGGQQGVQPAPAPVPAPAATPTP